MARSSSHRLWVASASLVLGFSSASLLPGRFPSGVGDLHFVLDDVLPWMEVPRLVHQHWNPLAAGSLRSPCCLPGAVPWSRNVPPARGTHTEVLEGTREPPGEATVLQSSLRLWGFLWSSPGLSRLLLWACQRLQSAPFRNAGTSHSRQRETWRRGKQFAIVKATRKASCMENQTEQEKQHLPSI